MPVDTTHRDYDQYAPEWLVLRHVLAGSRAVKAEGTAYLPKLSEQEDEDYQAYKDRAQFVPFTGRSLATMKGFVFRKDPQFTFPDAMVPFMDDATLRGISFHAYCEDTVRDVLSLGRRGTLIDYASEPENRPYAVAYCAEDIINWKVERRGSRMVLTMLVLHECDPTWIPMGKADKSSEPDPYQQGEYDQWRVLELRSDADGQGYVTVTTYRRKEEKKKTNGSRTQAPGGSDDDDFLPIEQKVLTRRGDPLTFIPFVFHGPHNSLPAIDPPPLLDMAEVNLSHYRTSADLENGRHFTGLPTPWAAGFDTKEDFKIGSTCAWVSDNPQAKVGFLEFNGEGLGALEKAIEQKERQMAALGARMLQPEAQKAEAYDTVAMRSAAETSFLQTATNSVTQSLSDIMTIVDWWQGTAANPADLRAEAFVELNSDFTTLRLPASDITALTSAYLGAAIDFETYVHNLRQGDIIPPGRTDEEIKSSIEQNIPGLPPPPEPPAAGGA